MAGLEDFGHAISSQKHLTYDQKLVDKISKNRRNLENKLFFDRLLDAIGIEDGSKLYPPKSHAELQTLCDTIVSSQALDIYKQSLIYYVLKDLKAERIKADAFAKACYMPSRYQTFVDGIWHLDRADYEKSVEFLTDPELVPTFPEEILYALCKNSKDNIDHGLAYYHSVMPPIVISGKTLDALFDVMCRASITEAFFFSRTHDRITHRHLFERLISFVHGASAGVARGDRAAELLGLPLDEAEEGWFEETLTTGSGKSLYGAKDTLIMRKIMMGRTEEAGQLSKGTRERKIDGLDWNSLTEGLRQPSN